MADTLDLADLVLARLRSLPNLDVFDNEEVDQAPVGAYVILRDGTDRLFAEHLDGHPRRYSWTFYLICAGRDQEQTRWCMTTIRNSLAGWRVNGSLLNEIDNGASVITDTTIPADVRLSRTLEYRLFTNWS